MEPIMKKRRGWKRIYPDLPGTGKTPSEEWITTSDQMLEIVVDFINAVIPAQRFVLAGCSYGGYLARGTTYRMPERVEGLLLICPVVTTAQAERTLPKHVTLVKGDSFASDLNTQEAQMFKTFAVVQTRKIFERTRNEIFPGLKIADTKFLGKIESHGYPFTFHVDAPSIIFEKPTLILVGRQDSMVGYHDSLKILENYPRATLAILDRAGHNLQIEQEPLFNALADEWLDRVEEQSTHASQEKRKRRR
jgi:pimeloyl-ACP methyl ester carboxylesterase